MYLLLDIARIKKKKQNNLLCCSWWCPAAEMMVSADSGSWGAPPGNKLCLPAHPGPSCITATNAGSWDSR